MKKYRLLAAVALISSASLFGCAEKLVILHTNDVHGNVRPERAKDRGGMVRAQVAVDSIRKAEKHTLLVDAGDDVQGYMYFSLFGGRVEYEMMNRMGYDAVAVGNHEFDNGLDSLKRNYGILKAAVVNANYDFSGTPLAGRVSPFVIKRYGGTNVALIGAGCDPDGLIIEENYRGMTYKAPTAVADSIAGALKAAGRADYAILLSHTGYLPDSIAALTTENIDLIIGGHSHTTVDPSENNHRYIFTNKAGKRVLVAQTGANGASIGKITVDLNRPGKLPEYELLPVDSRYDGRYDKDTEAWLESYDKAVADVMNLIIAQSEDDMPSGSDELKNWVADVLYEVGASIGDGRVDAAVTNAGGIRQPLEKGGVSQGKIMTMVPFQNSVLVLEMDGATLQRCLDDVVATGGQAVSRQLSFAAAGGKAADVKIGGKAIEPDAVYRIATIDYVASGKDNLTSFRDGKVVARSGRFMKYDFIDYVKSLAAGGKTIKADRTKRMY